LLQSVPGVGPTPSVLLLAQLPELGKLAPKQIAALGDAALFNWDSERQQGQRASMADAPPSGHVEHHWL